LLRPVLYRGRNMDLSVCLIVKNEEDNIKPCFESIKSIADEVIIVDTGSIDSTVEVAESIGLKVFKHQWKRDFSEARNFSISKATKDWIMWVDADDRIPEYSQRQIAELKNDPLEYAYIFQVKNINPQPVATALTSTFKHTRMWPRKSNVKFSGRLHETVLGDDLRAFSIKNNLFVAETNIVIEHHGYQDMAKLKEKMKRNIIIKLFEIGFPETFEPVFVEVGDLMCFYVPHALTIWKDMGMIWLSQPFEYKINRAREEIESLIRDYVKRNTFGL